MIIRQYHVQYFSEFSANKCHRGATYMNATSAMEADTTSGKTNICKNFINNELR